MRKWLCKKLVDRNTETLPAYCVLYLLRCVAVTLRILQSKRLALDFGNSKSPFGPKPAVGRSINGFKVVEFEERLKNWPHIKNVERGDHASHVTFALRSFLDLNFAFPPVTIQIDTNLNHHHTPRRFNSAYVRVKSGLMRWMSHLKTWVQHWQLNIETSLKCPAQDLDFQTDHKVGFCFLSTLDD